MLYTIVGWNKLNDIDTHLMTVRGGLTTDDIMKYNNTYDKKNLTYDQLMHSVSKRVSEFDREFFAVMQSNCEEPENAGKHYGMFEFDNETSLTPDEFLETIANRLSKQVLGCTEKLTGYLYTTGGGCHFISDQVFDFSDYMLVAKNLGCCDGFITMCVVNGFGGLRLGYKPTRPPDISYARRIGDPVEMPSKLVHFHDTIHTYLHNFVYLYDKRGFTIRPAYICTGGKVTGFEKDSNGDIKPYRF